MGDDRREAGRNARGRQVRIKEVRKRIRKGKLKLMENEEHRETKEKENEGGKNGR